MSHTEPTPNRSPRRNEVWTRPRELVLPKKPGFSLSRFLGCWIAPQTIDAGMRQHLAPGESLVMATRYSPVLAWGIPAVCFVLLIGAFDFLGMAPNVILLIAPAILGIRGTVRTLNLSIALTNRRVIVRTGFLRREYSDFLLYRIPQVRLNLDPVGWCLGYGTITFEAQSERPLVAKNVAGARAFRSLLVGLIEGTQARYFGN